MSLTGQLKDKNSAVSVWFDKHVASASVNKFVGEANDVLATRPQTVLMGGNPQLVGAAFDYYFRWHARTLQFDELTAYRGAKRVNRRRDVRKLIEYGQDEASRAACCVGLAQFEMIYRGNIPGGLPPFRTMIERNDRVVEDVATLGAGIDAIWAGKLLSGYTPNPVFTGSRDVNGADADWIAEGALWECKVSTKSKPMLPQHVYQLLGYMLLDYHNDYRLDRIGWYYPAHSSRVVMMMKNVLMRFFTIQDLFELRSDFAQAMIHQRFKSFRNQPFPEA